MKPSRFSEEWFALVLYRADIDVSVEEMCRKVGYFPGDVPCLEKIRRNWSIGVALAMAA